MNSRERVLAAIQHQPVDRVPTDIWATGEVWDKLRAHFGQDADIGATLHIDGLAGVGPEYVGPPLPECGPGEYEDFWGMRFKTIRYPTGSYSEQCVWPLAGAKTIDDLERYRWPSADWFDFSKVQERARALAEKQVVTAGYSAPFYYHNLLRGLETSFMDPLDDPEFTHHLIGHISDFFHEFHSRLFESADGCIDVSQVTDDYGSQTGPLIGLGTFREFYRPHLKRAINLCHDAGVRVMHHDDGAIRTFLPDLVEMGIDILNPVQHACPGMEMEGLKRDFGKALCFHGGIDNQDVLPFGSPEDVRAEVRHAIDALASDGTGYILAPCHNIQAVSPVENIIAMYDEAWNYGKVG